MASCAGERFIAPRTSPRVRMSEVRYGPFRLSPRLVQTFVLLLPPALMFALQGLHETTIHCQRDQSGLSCTVRESPSCAGGDPFTPVSALSTRRVVRSRSVPHAIGRVLVLDTQGREHESFDVSYADSAALASALQRFISDGTDTHFDESLAEFRFGLALGVLFLGLGLLALGTAIRGSGSALLSVSPERDRLAVARKFCGVTFSRYELDVGHAAAVEIAWSPTDARGQSGLRDLSGRLRVITPDGNAFIPRHYAGGRKVHLRGAAELRELLQLPPMYDELFEPALAPAESGLGNRIGTVVCGIALGTAEGLCLMYILSVLLGPRPTPFDLSPLWLIAVSAALGAIVAQRWERRRFDNDRE